MNISLAQARHVSLALLLAGLLNQAHILPTPAGTAVQSSGMLRLGRDLMRRTGGGEATGAEGTSEWISSRSIRTRRS
jgi:hypothetical protein